MKTLGLLPDSKKQKHCTACLWPILTGYREIKLHVILVGDMGTGDYLQRLYRTYNISRRKNIVFGGCGELTPPEI